MSLASGNTPSDLIAARRRIPRYPIAVPVDVTVLRSGLPNSIPGRSLDIGEGGVAAVLAAEVQPGEWVAVEFQLPNAGQSLQTKAVVRHHNQLRCGLEFLGLSRDQRYMIRHWAGSAQPEFSRLDSPVIGPPPAKMWPQTPALSQGHAKRMAPRWLRISLLIQNPPLRRLLGLSLTLLLLVGFVAAWQWHHGWKQLESRMAKKDVHARAPSAHVPPETMDRLLIRKVEPTYPEAARRANLQGEVVLDAVIAADGTVVNLYPVSGPDALASAAMDAVRWWRFRPYRVKGEPAPVETTIAIEFRP